MNLLDGTGSILIKMATLSCNRTTLQLNDIPYAKKSHRMFLSLCQFQTLWSSRRLPTGSNMSQVKERGLIGTKMEYTCKEVYFDDLLCNGNLYTTTCWLTLSLAAFRCTQHDKYYNQSLSVSLLYYHWFSVPIGYNKTYKSFFKWCCIVYWLFYSLASSSNDLSAYILPN